MKKQSLYVLVSTFVSLLFCTSNFPTRYENIEPDKVRNLAFVFEPADISPGDTVNLNAYFGGEEIDSVGWRVSLDYRITSAGSQVFLNETDLDSIAIDGSEWLRITPSKRTTLAQVSFVVPADIITRNAPIPENWSSLLDAEVKKQVPQELLSLSKTQLLAVIGTFLENPSLIAGGESDTLKTLLRAVGSLLNTRICVYADAYSKGYKYTSFYEQSIRYNHRLESTGLLPVNKSPQIDWIRMYRVPSKGATMTFDPDVDAFDTSYQLYDRSNPERKPDTVDIDLGYAYFVASDGGSIGGVDTRDYGQTNSGITERETYFYDWFGENIDKVDGAKNDELMVVSNAFNSRAERLYPPVRTSMKNFSIWCVLFDSFYGEVERPVGFSFAEVQGVFRYSEAYQKRYKK